MRIAFFAKSKRRTGMTRSLAAALERAGHRLLWVNQRKRRRWLGASAARAWTLRQVARFGPDLVLVHGDDIDPATLEGLAVHARSALFTAGPWNPPLGASRRRLARRLDCLLTPAAGQLPALREAGAGRAAWLPEACDPALHYPVEHADAQWVSELAFIGKARGVSARPERRARFVKALAERFDLRIYGSGWERFGLRAQRREVGPPAYRQICRGASIVLGFDQMDDCELYFSNRTWLTLGCGGFLLTNYVPGLERIFANHRELVWFRSLEECCELVEHYLPRPEERRRIAEAGHAFAFAHRSYDHFARDLLSLVAGEPLAFPPAGRCNA